MIYDSCDCEFILDSTAGLLMCASDRRDVLREGEIDVVELGLTGDGGRPIPLGDKFRFNGFRFGSRTDAENRFLAERDAERMR